MDGPPAKRETPSAVELITAPCDGRVVHLTTPAGAKVQEGDRVHERQPLVRIVPAAR